MGSPNRGDGEKAAPREEPTGSSGRVRRRCPAGVPGGWTRAGSTSRGAEGREAAREPRWKDIPNSRQSKLRSTGPTSGSTCFVPTPRSYWLLCSTRAGGVLSKFREERDVIVRTSLARLEQLDVGEQALCFGRIDRISGTGPGTGGPEGGAGDGEHREVESFHIGRLGVSAEDLEPLVVDWRAPVSEPFYRATGRDPMGLVLRRHLASSGRRVIGIEDERFAITDAAPRGSGRGGGPVSDTSSVTHVGVEGREEEPGEGVLDADLEQEIGGPGALLAAIGSARGGHMRDIVATIQREQDEIIRAALPGVLVVQGGPGTGKTAVALHRAAVPALHAPFPARASRRAGDRSQSAVLALHRARSSLSRGERRHPLDGSRPGARGGGARAGPRGGGASEG